MLSRALAELFSEPHLAGDLALRGGTALNKLFIRPPSRYSEDIDLVQARPRAIGEVLDAVRRRLDPWLGRPKRSSAVASVTLLYRFESEVPPVRPMRLKIEINTREHFAILGFKRRQLSVENPWFSGTADVTTHEIDELLGTKLRALYQRRKGRDLFDLWLCLDRGLADAAQVVKCFLAYMQREGSAISRAEFERTLHEKQQKPSFQVDLVPLLAEGVAYDAAAAMTLIQKALIERLPGEPWRGSPGPVEGAGSQEPPRRKNKRKR